MHPVRFARRRPKLALLLVVVVALAFAGAAYALWTMTQQTQNFQGQTGNTITLTINTPTAGDLSAAQQCFPGGSCPILAEVSNPTSTPVTLTSYQPSVSGGFSDSGSACTSPSLGGPAQGTTSVPISPGIVVAANAVNQVVTIPNALTLTATAGASCQNKNIQETTGHLTVTFTAGS